MSLRRAHTQRLGTCVLLALLLATLPRPAMAEDMLLPLAALPDMAAPADNDASAVADTLPDLDESWDIEDEPLCSSVDLEQRATSFADTLSTDFTQMYLQLAYTPAPKYPNPEYVTLSNMSFPHWTKFERDGSGYAPADLEWNPILCGDKVLYSPFASETIGINSVITVILDPSFSSSRRFRRVVQRSADIYCRRKYGEKNGTATVRFNYYDAKVTSCDEHTGTARFTIENVLLSCGRCRSM